ncbi:DNA alkylation repair protein [Gordonia sp. CPCC 205515]|uniref:DNA alkylation repair protein n=1 Tax=Gordonia sp. CPCC 205515 TaxID=3140791 RepID=UPI003AF3A2D0
MAALAEVADPERAIGSARFFKTGPGEYGEGDVFIGVTVPAQRKVAKRFRGVDAETVNALLASAVHEHRLTALILLRNEFERADKSTREPWVEQYRAAVRAGRVDNWDLVDSSADPILGEWLRSRADYGPLLEYARDPELWPRRVGIVGTFAFLKHGSADATLAVVPIVLDDRRDLIQKASGWMLRELGKRVDRELLLGFLEEHAAQMGRTALSYATEHLTVEQRAHYRAL